MVQKFCFNLAHLVHSEVYISNITYEYNVFQAPPGKYYRPPSTIKAKKASVARKKGNLSTHAEKMVFRLSSSRSAKYSTGCRFGLALRFAVNTQIINSNPWSHFTYCGTYTSDRR